MRLSHRVKVLGFIALLCFRMVAHADSARVTIVKSSKALGYQFGVLVVQNSSGHVAEWDAFPVSTGKSHDDGGVYTQTGTWNVSKFDRFKKSNTYPKLTKGGAKMPWGVRVYGGVWMHVGYVSGFNESHGCIRLPGVGVAEAQYSKGELVFKVLQKYKGSAKVQITNKYEVKPGYPTLGEIKNRVAHPKKIKELNFGVVSDAYDAHVTNMSSRLRVKINKDAE